MEQSLSPVARALLIRFRWKHRMNLVHIFSHLPPPATDLSCPDPEPRPLTTTHVTVIEVEGVGARRRMAPRLVSPCCRVRFLKPLQPCPFLVWNSRQGTHLCRVLEFRLCVCEYRLGISAVDIGPFTKRNGYPSETALLSVQACFVMFPTEITGGLSVVYSAF